MSIQPEGLLLDVLRVALEKGGRRPHPQTRHLLFRERIAELETTGHLLVR